MRGDDQQQGAMFSYIAPEQRVSADHPLRPIRQMVDDVLRGLSPQFDAVYARTGRPSIARRSCCAPSCCRCSTRYGANAS
jgi:hypothetical protein